jgi:hypothetical protein
MSKHGPKASGGTVADVPRDSAESPSHPGAQQTSPRVTGGLLARNDTESTVGANARLHALMNGTDADSVSADHAPRAAENAATEQRLRDEAAARQAADHSPLAGHATATAGNGAAVEPTTPVAASQDERGVPVKEWLHKPDTPVKSIEGEPKSPSKVKVWFQKKFHKKDGKEHEGSGSGSRRPEISEPYDVKHDAGDVPVGNAVMATEGPGGVVGAVEGKAVHPEPWSDQPATTSLSNASVASRDESSDDESSYESAGEGRTPGVTPSGGLGGSGRGNGGMGVGEDLYGVSDEEEEGRDTLDPESSVAKPSFGAERPISPARDSRFKEVM